MNKNIKYNLINIKFYNNTKLLTETYLRKYSKFLNDQFSTYIIEIIIIL